MPLISQHHYHANITTLCPRRFALRLIRKTTFCTYNITKAHKKQLIYDGFLNLFWGFFHMVRSACLLSMTSRWKLLCYTRVICLVLGYLNFWNPDASGRTLCACRILPVGMSLCLIHRIFMAVLWISLFFGFQPTNIAEWREAMLEITS